MDIAGTANRGFIAKKTRISLVFSKIFLHPRRVEKSVGKVPYDICHHFDPIPHPCKLLFSYLAIQIFEGIPFGDKCLNVTP
jgi:hypothetical protein